MEEYKEFERTCGYGDVTGIGGANCRHSFFPFVEGVSERTWTDGELARIDPEPFEFEGRWYTAYQATQKQRQMEATVRRVNRERIAYEAAGLKDDALASGIRLQRLRKKYGEFSAAAGLPEQRERMFVAYPDAASQAKATAKAGKQR